MIKPSKYYDAVLSAFTLDPLIQKLDTRLQCVLFNIIVSL